MLTVLGFMLATASMSGLCKRPYMMFVLCLCMCAVPPSVGGSASDAYLVESNRCTLQAIEKRLGFQCRYTYFINPGPLASIPGVSGMYSDDQQQLTIVIVLLV